MPDRAHAMAGNNNGLGIAIAIVAVIVVIAVIVLVNAHTNTGTVHPPSNSTKIPAQYAAAYSTLNSTLLSFYSNVSSIPNAPAHRTVYSTELLYANGNIGPGLLKPGSMQNVIEELDAFQKLGIQGVTIDIPYPLLVPSYPNSSSYLNFYEQVADAARARGMEVGVEADIVLTKDAGLSSVQLPANFSYSTYLSGKIQMDQIIINDIRPDYIDLNSAEPDTEYTYSGLSQLATTQGYYTYISNLLDNLTPNNSTTIVVGVSTWDNSSYDGLLLDYLNNPRIKTISMHVYPLYGNNLETLIGMSNLIAKYNKSIDIDEMWGHHELVPTPGGLLANPQASFKLEPFSFWAPLDQQFLLDMYVYSKKYDVVYMSPFDSPLLFSYVNYSSALNSTTGFQMHTIGIIASQDAILNNTTSSTGRFYSKLISNSSG